MIHRILIFKVRLNNVMYWIMNITAICAGGVFAYKLLIDIEKVKSLSELGLPLDIALYSGIIAIMCEPRPLNTEGERREDNKIINNGLFLLILLTVLNALIFIVLAAI